MDYEQRYQLSNYCWKKLLLQFQYGEDILLHVWSYDETMEAFSQGLLNSAAMSVALLWLQLNHQRHFAAEFGGYFYKFDSLSHRKY